MGKKCSCSHSIDALFSRRKRWWYWLGQNKSSNIKQNNGRCYNRPAMCFSLSFNANQYVCNLASFFAKSPNSLQLSIGSQRVFGVVLLSGTSIEHSRRDGIVLRNFTVIITSPPPCWLAQQKISHSPEGRANLCPGEVTQGPGQGADVVTEGLGQAGKARNGMGSAWPSEGDPSPSPYP